MNYTAIEKSIIQIIEKREQLKQLGYNDPQYDTIEEELHDLEDAFHDEYGDAMEEILQDIHDDLCPESDVLLPIAYLANMYIKDENGVYQVPAGEGVYVEADEFPGGDTKLALAPSPLRIVLNVGKSKQQVVWTSKGA
ncbi:MAG TPA: hypothetical protein PKC24_04125 [Cyclobacteriaceae bacterium]|nr:hypothetical protein [Cyclobacteriaceae bacterium]